VPTTELRPWLLAEDEAIKEQFSGWTVTGREGQEIPVKAFFSWPEKEIIERRVPFITVDLVGIERAAEREHRGLVDYTQMAYEHYGYPEVNGETDALITDLPVPYDLTYQVTAHCFFAQHDRELMAKILTYCIRDRYASVIAANTNRRVTILSTSPLSGRDEHNRRIFRQAIVLQIPSEIPEPVAEGAIKRRIESVNLEIEKWYPDAESAEA